MSALTAKTQLEIEGLAARWPDEYRLGYRFGFRGKADSPCDAVGYPKGFHRWSLERRNAWWCGWNQGRVSVAKAAESNSDGL